MGFYDGVTMQTLSDSVLNMLHLLKNNVLYLVLDLYLMIR